MIRGRLSWPDAAKPEIDDGYFTHSPQAAFGKFLVSKRCVRKSAKPWASRESEAVTLSQVYKTTLPCARFSCRLAGNKCPLLSCSSFSVFTQSYTFRRYLLPDVDALPNMATTETVNINTFYLDWFSFDLAAKTGELS